MAGSREALYKQILGREISTLEGLDGLYKLGYVYVPGGGVESIIVHAGNNPASKWYREVVKEDVARYESFFFWDGSSFFNYPVAMVSATHCRGQRLSAGRNFVMFADSGGFGVDGPVKLHPTSDHGELLERIEWQKSISDVAFVFDYYNTKKDTHDECVRLSEYYGKLYCKRMEGDSSTRMFLVTHGGNLKYLFDWCDHMEKLPHAGWGTGTDFHLTAIQRAWRKFLAACYVAYRYGKDTPVHLLGITPTGKYHCLVKALEPHLPRFSSDGSSWRFMGTNGIYLWVGANGKIITSRYGTTGVGKQFGERVGFSYERYCVCPVCVEMDRIGKKVGYDKLWHNPTIYGYFLSLHNLYLIVSLVDAVPYAAHHPFVPSESKNWNTELFTDLAGKLVEDFPGAVDHACNAVGMGVLWE